MDPALVARVRAAIEAVHYRPRLGASMLRRNDRPTGTIGLLLEDVGNRTSRSSAAPNRRPRSSPGRT